MSGAPSEVAVIGAGRMGSGIAHAFLVAGSHVRLYDLSDAARERGAADIARWLATAHDRGLLLEAIPSVLNRLDLRPAIDDLSSADLVVEAVPEREDLKRSILSAVSASTTSDTLIATNTSSISIDALAGSVQRPERFLGMHFFNPVPSSSLVELIRGAKTSDEAVTNAVGWTEAVGKTAIVVNDAPGFATSRLGLAIGLEAIRMLEAGVASAADIDRGMVLGYGFPMGPLRLTDLVGLDVRLGIATYLESRLGERFRPPTLLRDMVARGELGRKTGRGFFDWSTP